jgi:hypothetical protein
MTETTTDYDIEADVIFARVKTARANAETLRRAAADAEHSIDELTRLVEGYRLRERYAKAREARGE